MKLPIPLLLLHRNRLHNQPTNYLIAKFPAIQAIRSMQTMFW